MARLLVENESYEGLAPNALLEHEYEAIVLDRAASIFPGLIVVPFKPTIVYEGVPKQPDIAIIDPQYRTWWVGEAELADHSLHRHVLPQVEVLSRGRYGPEAAEWLAQRSPTLDGAALHAMMLGTQPQVVVILNAPRPEWEAPLRALGAVIAVVELFRSSQNRLIVRRNGADLEVEGNVLSICTVNRMMPRMLQVESPVPVLELQEPLEIELSGGVTSWLIIELADRVWLSPARGNPFPEGVTSCRLVRSIEGRLRFEAFTNPRRKS